MFQVSLRTSRTPNQSNILVETTGHIRIADFGLAKIAKNLGSIRATSHQKGFTIRWAAPEVLSEEAYGEKADVYSLALVMIEVRHMKYPTRGQGLTAVLCRYRCLPARFRSTTVQISMLCLQQYGASVPHGRPTQPLQLVCGCWCDTAGIPTLTRAQKLRKSCKYSSTRQFLYHSDDHPFVGLTVFSRAVILPSGNG